MIKSTTSLGVLGSRVFVPWTLFMVLWCAVVLFPSGVGGGALYLVVRPGGLAGGCQEQPVHFLFPLSLYFTHAPPIWSIYSKFDSLPSFIFPFASFFIDNSAARYCVTLSGWIRMDWQTHNLPPTPRKGTLFNPWGRFGRFLLEFGPVEFLRAHLAPITPLCHHFPTLPAFVFATERFCPNYFSLTLFHQLHIRLPSQTPSNTLTTFQSQSIS